MKTALGFRHHSGWAIVVAVSGGASPTVLHRERVELCPPTLPRQVYHDVGERALSLAAAAARIDKVETAVEAAALAVVRHAADTFAARSVGRVAEAARALSLDDSDVDAMLIAIGKELGPPWQKDYKDATLAALIALSHP